jgi:hypothetical protein
MIGFPAYNGHYRTGLILYATLSGSSFLRMCLFFFVKFVVEAKYFLPL